MMWNILHISLDDLVGNDRQALIKLHRISVDDFAIILAGYLYGQLLFLGQREFRVRTNVWSYI
jgi:hypothetical protein